MNPIDPNEEKHGALNPWDKWGADGYWKTRIDRLRVNLKKGVSF